MTLNTVELRWDLTDLIESGLSATLSITPTAQMSDTTDHVLIPPVARTYNFTGGAGQLAGIIANDNEAILPAGAGYLISVTSASGQVIVPQFQTQLLYADAVDGVLWLDELAIVPVVTTGYQYLPLTTGTPEEGQVPVFTGSGYATTPGAGGGGGGVSSFDSRTGAVTPQSGDYSAFYDALGAAATAQSNAETFATSAVATETSRAEAAEALLAPKASPALTGSPTAPTQTTGDSSTKIATDAFVAAAVATETTRAETAEALLAPKASPTFTGTPAAPTASPGTNTTQLATTAYAFVAAQAAQSAAESASDPAGSAATAQANAEAYAATLVPLTTKGDLLYENATPAPARLPVGSAGQVLGVSGGLPVWAMGFTLLATAGLNGYALVNGTGASAMSWTAPNDGAMHRCLVIGYVYVTSAETGGQLNVNWTDPAGNALSPTFVNPNLAVGANGPTVSWRQMIMVKAGTVVSVPQVTALTAGAATFWGEIWGS